VGANLSTRHEAGALIYGSAVGCDLTRRDLQAAAKKAGGPWDAAKAFDHSAPVGLIAPIEKLGPDLFDDARLRLFVNESEKQSASLRSMIFTVPEILIALSKLFELRPGDLVFTGTPEGVGPLVRGDRVRVELDPLPPLEFSIADCDLRH
jgi:fumarylpyruvate hydrolase